ncbi:Alpha/Beta hydrolase protein [Microdochium trichocladiopsis]|uniref:Alpha/Beta hydrolase protein n=1 Tax=Microdochium trichocladiopsis TaxID=1682393 RepID=A0A9P8Y168_9PEZI|nr:Alpha/Beta hydrolase protein [Microdochium trichocladiopsis]KAH7025679.1 Alpha/Beta hydrolase protein [Microdochium trichocladiopsis]
MTTTNTPERTVYQPIHESLKARLDPEYVTFHEEVLQFIKPQEWEAWDPASRLKPSAVTRGSQMQVEVGNVTDYDIGSMQARVFTPAGEQPEAGWPVLVWLHGGGWVMGGLTSENGFLRHVCRYIGIAVVTINYRHAPEHRYPIAVEDSLAGYKWVLSRAADLQINLEKVVLGGLSAGGNLAAILSMKIIQAELPSKPRLLLLICPVIDNTADIKTGWIASQHAPWLTSTRMTWYRDMYLDADQASSWDASPCFATSELLSRNPKTFIMVAECDLLAPEALDYAHALSAAGVVVEHKVFPGATHSMLVLAGINERSRQVVHDACDHIASEVGHSYDRTTAPILPAN